MPLQLKEPRKGSSNLRIRGTYLGVPVDRSAGTADRTVAQKMLKKVEREIERGVFQTPLKKTLGFAEAAFRYIRDGHDKRFIQKLVGHFGETPIDQIGQLEIDDASFALYPNVKNATRNRQVHVPMSAILRHCGVDIRLRRPEGAKGAKRTFFFKPEQCEALIGTALQQNREFGIFLMFLFYTGVRLSEACNIEISDVELQHALAFCGKTKNGEPRRLYLPPPLVAALACHPRGLDRSGKLFCFERGWTLYEYFKKACEASGVRVPDRTGFHAFRHTYGAYMRRYAKLDTSGLIATGAWKSAEAARVYEHADVSEAARGSDLFPALKLSV